MPVRRTQAPLQLLFLLAGRGQPALHRAGRTGGRRGGRNLVRQPGQREGALLWQEGHPVCRPGSLHARLQQGESHAASSLF